MEKIKFALDSARTTDKNGFLHVAVSHITKATVNPYQGDEIPGWREAGLQADKIYYALRDPDELKASLSTWAGIPLQFEHPEGGDGAEETKARETRVGAVGTEVRWNAPYLDAPLTVWDQTAIDAIKDGTCRELSCAYWYEPDFTPGTYEGQPYDFVMRRIKGNHVALVPEGRAGHDVLVADSATKINQLSTTGEGKNMPKTKLARDGDPAIEQKELALGEVIETAGKKLQELHDIDEAGNVVDKPAEGAVEAPEAQDGDLDALKAKYNLDDAAIAEIKAALTAPAADEAEGEAQDEEPAGAQDEGEDAPAAQDEEDMIKDAMESCGLDADNPELVKAFSAGLHHGSKEEGQEEKAKAPTAADMEEAAQKAEDRALRRFEAGIKARYRAAEQVAPLVGKLDVLTFDSAESIYRHALQRQGVSIAGVKPAMYETLLRGFMAAKFPQVKRRKFAADSASRGYAFEKNLNNIRIED